MDVFHVVVDTSVLRRVHFRHPDFERLLRRSRQGALKLYIPFIAIEELRTGYLDIYEKNLAALHAALGRIKRNDYAILLDGMAQMDVQFPTKEDVDKNSRAVFSKFLQENKIEVLTIAPEHASEAWKLYFDASPPFDRSQEREHRRKDIPDSWILIAARALRDKQGRHCALVGDTKLSNALAGEGFEVFDQIETLDMEVERATAVSPIAAQRTTVAAQQLQDLRGDAFRDVDKLILGFIEALNVPTKRELFEALQHAGVTTDIAEHEASTLALAGVLKDASEYYLPSDRELAMQAASLPIVLSHLSRIL